MPQLGTNFRQILPYSSISLGTGIDPGPTVNEFGTNETTGLPGDLVLAAGNPASPLMYASAFDPNNKQVFSVNQTATVTPVVPLNPNAANGNLVVKKDSTVLFLVVGLAAYFLFFKHKGM